MTELFNLPDGCEILGMEKHRDKIIVATTRGVYQLNKDNEWEGIPFEEDD